MKLLKKTTLSLALAAVMVGGLSATSHAAVNSGSDATGDVLLFPHYTTENGYQTSFTLTNSNNDDTVLAKLRFRDYKDSLDVLDITVILSPNDVFTGTIRQDSAGQVVFTRSSDDTTCTSPIRADRNFVAGGQNPNANGEMGHVEVLTMATIDKSVSANTYPNLAAMVARSTHDSNGNNTAADCAVVDGYFRVIPDSAGRDVSDLQRELTALYAANPTDQKINSNLFGEFTVYNAEGGIAASGRPTTISGVYDGELYSPCDETGALNTSLVCGQVVDKGHFTFPHLLHVAGVDATNVNKTPAENVTAYRVFEDKIRAAGMANNWSRNVGNNVQAEMIWTLPTKYVSNDSYPAHTTATNAAWNSKNYSTSKDAFTGVSYVSTEASKWDNVDEALTGEGLYIDRGTEAGCLAYSTTPYDREEQTFTNTGGGTDVSGGQENGITENRICNEVTVLTFGDGQGVTRAAPANYTMGSKAQLVPTNALSQDFGWVKVYSRDESNTFNLGAPVIGYTMLNRQLDGADLSGNYGQLVNNIKLNHDYTY